MVNLVKNLGLFLAEIQSQVANVTEADGKLIIKLRREILADVNEYLPFVLKTTPLLKS